MVTLLLLHHNNLMTHLVLPITPIINTHINSITCINNNNSSSSSINNPSNSIRRITVLIIQIHIHNNTHKPINDGIIKNPQFIHLGFQWHHMGKHSIRY